MLSILQNAQSWIDVFTETSNIRKIKQRVKVYELRIFHFFVTTSFQQYALLQNRHHLDRS